MVKLHVKRGDESHFLYEATTTASICDVLQIIVSIYNGRLKIQRICKELEELSKHGTCLSHNAQLNEHDFNEWPIPNGGYIETIDPSGRRNGKAPIEKMANAINKVVAETSYAISKECVSADVCLAWTKITELLDMLRDVVALVYPKGLPPYDPIQQEFENNENLTGQQSYVDVIDLQDAQLWWAGKQLDPENKLYEYIGKNEKTKLVVKLQKCNQGPPKREPILGEEQQKQFMLHAYRRQEELKSLEDEDDNYLDAQWADKQALKKAFHGVHNVSWKPH